ncbi:hypothetical protein DSO57_1024738 [Entomophthora muscae]|uniref:Uncharacterized protein n=1 Tax=Entomophthora muscae TaxID=34485 RepID=A0ACC2UP53_9FUNG|nr:hypothetical protein DSO57_1024738 [Entomophthora muscae]
MLYELILEVAPSRPTSSTNEGDPNSSPRPRDPLYPQLQQTGVHLHHSAGVSNQVIPHTGPWYPWATAANYLAQIAPTVYMAVQAWPATPIVELLETSMGSDNYAVRYIMGQLYGGPGRVVREVARRGSNLGCSRTAAKDHSFLAEVDLIRIGDLHET